MARHGHRPATSKKAPVRKKPRCPVKKVKRPVARVGTAFSLTLVAPALAAPEPVPAAVPSADPEPVAPSVVAAPAVPPVPTPEPAAAAAPPIQATIPAPVAAVPVAPGAAAGDRPFAADSVWNRPLDDAAPLDARSDALLAD